MRAPRYPLESLAELRDRKVDRAARDLTAAAVERQRAEHARARAETARNEHLSAARRLRAIEADALGRGERTAADLQRVAAWEIRVGLEAGALEEDARAARARVAEASGREQDARGLLGRCRGEADAVERDRAKWVGAVRRRADAKDEEASAEAWRGGAATASMIAARRRS